MSKFYNIMWYLLSFLELMSNVWLVRYYPFQFKNKIYMVLLFHSFPKNLVLIKIDFFIILNIICLNFRCWTWIDISQYLKNIFWDPNNNYF